MEDERTVRQGVRRHIVEPPGAPAAGEPLAVELRVDRVGAALPRMEISPDCPQAVVVLPAAERARPVPGRHGGRLVEEEELGELPRLEERPSQPAAELEPAGDPAPAVVASPDPAGAVVQATAVSVHEAAGRVGDELAERRHAVLERVKHWHQAPMFHEPALSTQGPRPDARRYASGRGCATGYAVTGTVPGALFSAASRVGRSAPSASTMKPTPLRSSATPTTMPKTDSLSAM